MGEGAEAPAKRNLSSSENRRTRSAHRLAGNRQSGRQTPCHAGGTLYVDDALYFTAGPKTRKAVNIARNPNCVITIATHDFDLVIEGPATRIVNPARLKQIAEIYTKEGWSPTVVKDGLTAKYSAPSAGPPPWHVYEIKPETIFALGTSEPYGATRWNFRSETRRK